MKLSKNVRLGGSSVTTKFGSDSEDVVIEFTPYVGAETFSWTLDGSTVDSHGFYWDGTPYVVPVGSSVTVKAVSPAPKEHEFTNATFVGGDTGTMTVRYDGVMINPVMGLPQDKVDVLAGTYTNTTGGPNNQATTDRITAGYGLTTDNRINADLELGGNGQPTAQEFTDAYFDVTQFTNYKNAFPGDGVEGTGQVLNTGDVMVLTRSNFTSDPGRDNFNQQNSRLGATELYWGARSGVEFQAFLYVVDLAPTDTDFRPPPQWLDSNNRPKFTMDDLVNLSGYEGEYGNGIIADIYGNGAFGPENDWSIVWGEGSTETKPPVSAFFPAPILVDDGYYSASLSAWNILPGLDTTYGGQAYNAITGYLFNRMLDTNSTSEANRLLAQKKLVQAGIDCLGAMKCRIGCTGGAGQRAGQTTPLALFALRNLGDQRPTDDVGIEDLARWIWDITPLEWSNLTELEKHYIMGSQSYEENVVWRLGLMQTNEDASFPVGETYTDSWGVTSVAQTVSNETMIRAGDVLTNAENATLACASSSLSAVFSGTLDTTSLQMSGSVTKTGFYCGDGSSELTRDLYSSTASEYSIVEDAGNKILYVRVPLNISEYATAEDFNGFFTLKNTDSTITVDGSNLYDVLEGANNGVVTRDQLYGNTTYVELRFSLSDAGWTNWTTFKGGLSPTVPMSINAGVVAYVSTGEYSFDNTSQSYSRLTMSGPFSFRLGTSQVADNESQGTHASGHTNLIGCTATVDGQEYYITGVSETAERYHYELNTNNPVTVYLDRPLHTGVVSSIDVAPFRTADTNKFYYIREPQTKEKWRWATPSAWNDDYSNYFHKNANLPYALMRLMDGNWSKLGSCGQLMDQYYFSGSDGQTSWQVFNDAQKKFGSVSQPAAFNNTFSTSALP